MARKKGKAFEAVGEFGPIVDSIEDTGIMEYPEDILPEGDYGGPPLMVTGNRMGRYQNPGFEYPPSRHSPSYPGIYPADNINESNEIERGMMKSDAALCKVLGK